MGQSLPRLRIITVRLMYAVAVFWFGFAVYWLFTDSDYRLFYGATAVINALLIALLGYFLGKRKPWARWAAILILGFNVLTTVTDQVGWFDWLYLVPAVVLFALVIGLKKDR